MLYNIETKKVKEDLDCIDCKYFDKDIKKCKGLGVACFEFDPITKTCIDTMGMIFDPNKVSKNER